MQFHFAFSSKRLELGVNIQIFLDHKQTFESWVISVFEKPVLMMNISFQLLNIRGR